MSHSSTPLYVDWAQRYEILHKVGAGGFAEVYEAYDRKLERPVALKVIADRPGMSGRVVREVEAAASLAHPGIVALYDFFGDGERSFLVWEFVEGQPLAAVQGELGDADAVMVGEQLAEALAYAHSQGVIHRDIKPQNVMIGDEGRAKLMDFGIARLMDAQTLTSEGDVLGTVAYMSPEQASSRRIGPASDVYSLGIVLYELLAGFNPVRGHTPAETMANVVAGRIEPLEEVRPDLPRGVTDAVDAATETEAGERPSAAAVAAELHAALDSGRLGHGRLRAWRVLRPLQRFAVLGERARRCDPGGRGHGGAARPLRHLSRELDPARDGALGGTLVRGAPAGPRLAAGCARVPGLRRLAQSRHRVHGVCGRPVLAHAWATARGAVAGARRAPGAGVRDLPGAGGGGRLRPPAWSVGGRLGRRRRALLPAARARLPFALHGLPASRPSRGTAPGGRQPAELPSTGSWPWLSPGPSLFQMAVWAGLALAVGFTLSLRHMLARLWAWSLTMCLVFVLYRVVPIRFWDHRVELERSPRRCLGVGGGGIVRGGLRRGATSRGAT